MKDSNASAVDLPPRLLITCEHASNDIPPELRSLFRGNGDLLRSHRGWDIGAKEIAERMAADLCAPQMLGALDAPRRGPQPLTDESRGSVRDHPLPES